MERRIKYYENQAGDRYDDKWGCSEGKGILTIGFYHPGNPGVVFVSQITDEAVTIQTPVKGSYVATDPKDTRDFTVIITMDVLLDRISKGVQEPVDISWVKYWGEQESRFRTERQEYLRRKPAIKWVLLQDRVLTP